jgi:hypothetical protein
VLLLKRGKLFSILVHHRLVGFAFGSWNGGGLRQCSSADRRLGFVSISNVSVFAGIALCTATVVGGSGYLIRELHRQVGVASAAVGLPNPIPEPSLSVEITAEMLHVSSIALGRVPLAVVNGTPITEGGSLEVQTASGSATLHVLSIVDGSVRFKNGNQTISANLGQTFPPKVVTK